MAVSLHPSPVFTKDWHDANVPLWSKLIERKPRKALEIGSLEGRSAYWLLANCPGIELTCIDPWDWPDIERRFDFNINGRATKIKGRSADVLPGLSGPFDWIYVDGSHHASDVLLDALQAWRLLAPGGLLIFDDYGYSDPQWGTPGPGIDAFLSVVDCKIIHKGYQVVVEKFPMVFGVGLEKTGTTSLHEALTVLGWRSVHFPPASLLDDPGDFNAFSDWPIFERYRELDSLYPGSRWVLTTRPFEDWIASRERHRKAWGTPEGWSFDRRALWRVWNAHHRAVRRHFGNRLLTLNLGDGWEPLCSYLGVPVPDHPYPWANKSP